MKGHGIFIRSRAFISFRAPELTDKDVVPKHYVDAAYLRSKTQRLADIVGERNRDLSQFIL